MKKNLTSMYSKLSILILSLLTTVVTFAQDKSLDVDINTKGSGGNFFSSPWVWVIGAAVFILLLVALLKGGGSKSE